MDIKNSPITPQPAEAVVYSPNRNRRLLLIIIILLITLIVGASAYYLGTKQTISQTNPAPTQVVIPTQIPTMVAANSQIATIIPDKYANWQTYTNLKNKFLLKYPNEKNIYIKEGGFIGFCDIGAGEVEIKIYYDDYVTPASPAFETDFAGKLFVVIAKKQKEASQTVDNWVNQYCPSFLERDIIREPFIIGGVQGVKFISKYKETEFEAAAWDVVLIPKDDTFYFIYGTADSDNNIENLFDPILKSFQFID